MCSVIVVGAGAAGMTAAYDIKMQSDCDVKVFEASFRHGGRIKKNDTLADFPIDLGAEWIESANGLDVLDEIVNDDDVDIDVDTFTFSLPYYVWVSVLNKFIKVLPTNDFGLHFKNSTWWDFFNEYIFDALDADEVVFNCEVEKIDYSSDDTVKVDTTCGSYDADRVVVAVPVKTLQDKDIEFEPEFPQERQVVVDSIEMPAGAKVFMRFSDKFYPDSFAVLKDLIKFPSLSAFPRYFYDETFGQDSNDNIMGLLAYGASAQALYADSTNEEILEDVIDELDDIFDGEASDKLEAAVVQNWSREPFINGAYSDQTLLASKKMAIMRKPLDGLVYFAGEWLPDPKDPDGWGFVQSAAFSGRYAVEQLLDSL